LDSYEAEKWYREMLAWYEETSQKHELLKQENEALRTLLLQAWLREEPRVSG
jgi:hypothetical protein